MEQHGIVCPKCGGQDAEVKDTRSTESGIRRRRMCGSCSHRFTTYEYIGKAHAPCDGAVQSALDGMRSSLASLSGLLAARAQKGEGT